MKTMKKKTIYGWVLSILFILPILTYAEGGTGKITLKFDTEDSIHYCKAVITLDGNPAKDVEVKLAVKRLFGLLPIGKGKTTDENGVATFEFPNDIPSDLDGKLTVIATTEDDENVGSIKAIEKVEWGVPRPVHAEMGRSLAASRGNAPIYFIVASLLIIGGIWGTLFYVLGQVFKIRKLSKHIAHK
jgi:hypothetical protein